MRKIYIAGSSKERELIRNLIVRARGLGYEITHDWEKVFGTLSKRRAAEEDFEGVRAADVLWYVSPKVLSEGSHFELGVACALRKTIVVSGDIELHHRIFTALATLAFDTHDEAIQFLGTHMDTFVVGNEGHTA